MIVAAISRVVVPMRPSIVAAAVLALLGTDVRLSAQQPAAPPQAPAPATAQGLIIQKIIVKVNGEILTQTDLEQRQIQALQDQKKDVRSAQDLQNNAVLRAALADVTPQILVAAVDELLLVQHGREMGFRLSDEMFKNAIDNIKKQNGLDDAALEAEMKRQGITRDALRENFEHAYLIQAVQQDITKDMTLTDEEKRQYYNAHKDEFVKPATISVREIAVNVAPLQQGGKPVPDPAADAAAKAKIEAIRDRAVKGEDFVKLVAEASDAGSKANGGLLSGILVADLDPAMAATFKALKPGDISDVLHTDRGYQLYKLETRSAAEPKPFDEVKADIGTRIVNERLTGEQKKYLDKLRAQALIEWKDDGYKQMYDKAQSAK